MEENEPVRWYTASEDGRVRWFEYSPWGVTECGGAAMEEDLTIVENGSEETGQMDEWVSTLMGSLVSSIAMALEDKKESPDWLEVSFLVGNQNVKIEVTIQDVDQTRNRMADQLIADRLLATKYHGTTNT